MTDKEKTELAIKRDNLITDCERSKLYHSARLRFYERNYRWVLSAAIIGGLVPVFQSYQMIIIYVPVAISALSILSLVFNFNGMARRHESLYQRFALLNADIEATSNFGQENLDNWNRAIQNIYFDEPPVYRALHKHCYNLVVQSLYLAEQPEYKKYYSPLTFSQRFLMNWFEFANINYKHEQ